MHILVRDKRTGAEDWILIEHAAMLMGMEADDIDAALEEFGECEVEDFIALDPE
ncbi:hypothetical protein [Shinella zoogloeoides]|uniref:hypothetical protein n=1 Tax=Shinella zoogloeoides TaxID=352475 RepID=UPI0013C320E7|nr:hypothetical protein [Shinella zoogloeoides]